MGETGSDLPGLARASVFPILFPILARIVLGQALPAVLS